MYKMLGNDLPSQSFNPVNLRSIHRTTQGCVVTTIGLFFLLISSSAFAEIYKWTDEQGRVHYSDKAPDKKADIIELKKEEKSSSQPSSKNNSMENTQRFLRALEEEKAIAREKEQELAKKREKKRAYCQRLEKEISIYNKGYAIVRYNQKGEHEYLTDQEIAEQKQKFDQSWKENCEDL